jgi:signal transduction histidine kinase
MRSRLGLRVRVTAWGTVAVAAVLALAGVLLVRTLDARLTGASDEVSRARLAGLLAEARGGDLPTTLTDVGDNGIEQVVGPGGRVLAASPNAAGRPPIAQLAAGAAPRSATLTGPDDAGTDTYRTWYAAGPAPSGPVTVYVGDSLESVGEASLALRRSLAVGVPAAVVALAAVIWWLLGRALGRLDRIRAEVDGISEETLGARVAGDGVDDEVGRLAATMNAMLDRIEGSLRRQRELVADVSHDLQSPLAAQRIALELALAGPDAVDRDRLRAEVLGATTDMEALVGDLVVLASLDSGAGPRPVLLDLDALVLEEAVRARTAAAVCIDTANVSGAPAYADPDDVRRTVRNLLDNAVAHAVTAVRLSVRADGRCAVLEVVDDGPGIAPEDRERVFERFYRADPARSRRDGSGLGLAIARGLAERSGGRLVVMPGNERGAHLRLTLPTDGAGR